MLAKKNLERKGMACVHIGEPENGIGSKPPGRVFLTSMVGANLTAGFKGRAVILFTKFGSEFMRSR